MFFYYIKHCFVLITISIFIFLSITACKCNIAQANASERIEINHNKQCEYNINVIFKDKKVPVLNSYAFEPSVTWLSKQLAEIKLTCGDPCKNSIFVDFCQEEISAPYENVLLVEVPKKIVVSAGDNEIYISKIFNENTNKIIIRRNFSPVANLVSAIEEVRFIDASKDLYIRYLTGDNFDTAEEIITLNLRELD